MSGCVAGVIHGTNCPSEISGHSQLGLGVYACGDEGEGKGFK